MQCSVEPAFLAGETISRKLFVSKEEKILKHSYARKHLGVIPQEIFKTLPMRTNSIYLFLPGHRPKGHMEEIKNALWLRTKFFSTRSPNCQLSVAASIASTKLFDLYPGLRFALALYLNMGMVVNVLNRCQSLSATRKRLLVLIFFPSKLGIREQLKLFLVRSRNSSNYNADEVQRMAPMLLADKSLPFVITLVAFGNVKKLISAHFRRSCFRQAISVWDDADEASKRYLQLGGVTQL